MTLKMTSREVDGAAVLALHGRIVLGDGHRALCDKLKNLMSEGQKRIVLNLDHIEHIDGFGLGVLIAAHLSAKAQGASLKLCHIGGKFQEVLQLTKLATVFHVSTTEAVALASFSTAPDEDPTPRSRSSISQAHLSESSSRAILRRPQGPGDPMSEK